MVKGPASDVSNAKKAQSAPVQNRNVQIATGTICPPLTDANADARFDTKNDNVKPILIWWRKETMSWSQKNMQINLKSPTRKQN